MKIIGVIPARYGSTRFPGKPLALIAGKPLLQWVIEQSRKASALADVVVATDNEKIAAAMRPFCTVEMTREDHPSGTDRIGELAQRLDCDGFVNIQGDEPLISPQVINDVALALDKAPMTTAATPIRSPDDYENPNVVKVVVNKLGRALYFSRRTIPFVRDAANRSAEEQMAAFPFLKHLGIYGYKSQTLLELIRLPVSPLEQAEKLEQLRALDNGINIQVVITAHESIGVDAPEDVQKVERLIRERNL